MNAESILAGVITGVLTGGITGYVQICRNPDLMTKAAEEFWKELLNLEQCMNEAVLYAEQSSYEQLQEMMTKIFEIIPPGEESRTIHSPDEAAEVLIGSAATREALRATLIELSKPVRNMLGLKKIVLKAPNE
jgi:hypothetical protein